MAKKLKPFIFRIRKETQANRATVWIIRTDGTAQAGLMHGTVGLEVANLLADFLEQAGAKIERLSFDGQRHDEPRPESNEEQQKLLFDQTEKERE